MPSWLPKAKVLAPEPPAGYVRRASLLHHIEGLLERRLTVLRAPAGFGKTTVLADVVCGVKAQGLVAGWISLDEDDTPSLFGSCLASAFEHAGLDLALLSAHDTWSSSPAVHQMGMLARVIELHAAPCLLVLDEVDRLPRSTVQLINLLLTRAPANLHLAMAFRSDPGLDLATHVLAGEAIVVGVRQCRFSTADIAQFFHGKLSRRELGDGGGAHGGLARRAAGLSQHARPRGDGARCGRGAPHRKLRRRAAAARPVGDGSRLPARSGGL